MAVHKYRVGQVVQHRPPNGGAFAAHKGYKVLRLLASACGEKLYRIKSITEIDPRIVEERDLVACVVG